MNDAYENALRMIAESYDSEVVRWGGKSLSRVATIVVSSGAFFNRLRAGKGLSVASLDKFAAWFRAPVNWPNNTIHDAAAAALISIGRPPLPADTMPHRYRTNDAPVDCDPVLASQSGNAA